MRTTLTIVLEPARAEGLIRYLARLGKDLQMNVHLMYLQEPYDYTIGQPPAPGLVYTVNVQKRNEEKAIRELKEFVSRVLSEMNGEVSVTYSAEVAEITQIINKYVSEKKASMVVMESQQNRSFWTQTTSSTYIIDHSDCPVLIIPYEAEYRKLKNIVYVTDYKEEDIPTLKSLIELTGSLQPSITALHITDNMDFEEKIKKAGYVDIIHERLSYNEISFKSLTEKSNDNIAELINDFAVASKADLIVILRENRSFFEKIFTSDSTKEIIKEANLPVLVYKY